MGPAAGWWSICCYTSLIITTLYSLSCGICYLALCAEILCAMCNIPHIIVSPAHIIEHWIMAPVALLVPVLSPKLNSTQSHAAIRFATGSEYFYPTTCELPPVLVQERWEEDSWLKGLQWLCYNCERRRSQRLRVWVHKIIRSSGSFTLLTRSCFWITALPTLFCWSSNTSNQESKANDLNFLSSHFMSLHCLCRPVWVKWFFFFLLAHTIILECQSLHYHKNHIKTHFEQS